MPVKMPNDPDKLKTLCSKYQQQLKELTQKCHRETLEWGMKEYYLNQKILDFEALCKQNDIEFSIVNERDKKRRNVPRVNG